MSELKNFQKATVKAVLKAFSRKDGTHRFLIADEVGLGKTLVAAEVVHGMAKKKEDGDPLLVLYVCSNLSIAAQNKRRLIEWLPEEERKIAICPVDRLTLLPEHQMQGSPQIRLYTLTPDTSIPTRGGHYSSGRKEERALIHAFVKKIWPEFFIERSQAYFKGGVTSNVWKDLVKKKLAFVSHRKNRALRDVFRDSLRRELELTEGMHVVAALNRIESEHENNGRSKIITLLRNALATGTIEQLQPDLVIFDEFQRFRDLLEEDIDESAARLINALRGDNDGNHLKLLMLSATPYRPYTRCWADEKYGQDNSHRKEFFDLLEFLYRRTAKAKRVSAACSDALLVMEKELRKGDIGSAQFDKARRTMEKALRGVICRTERVSQTEECSELTTSSLETHLETADLRVFKHMVRSFHDQHRSSASSYWSSIPLPMQTMGPSYQTWKAATELKDRTVPSFSKGQRNNFGKRLDAPHPRLRALKHIMPIERLKIPWIPPSAAWWPLKSLWNIRNGNTGKILVFSRFRAVPQAIASLMSYNLEAQLLSSDIEYEELSKHRSLQPKAGNESLLGHFYPSVFLVKNADPIAEHIGSLELARKSVEKQLRKALKDMGVRIRSRNQRRPTWSLIAALERKQLGSKTIDSILDRWAALHAAGVTAPRDGSETNFRRMLNAWRGASEQEISDITPLEFKDLARYALSAPGVVVGRALYRHWKWDVEDKHKGIIKCIEVSWKGLRNYLSSYLFVKTLTESEKRYPEAIRKAALEGNLESVLDEHLWITSKLGGAIGAELANELIESLRVRTSNFFMHSLGNKSKRGRFSLRCHAVMPFTDPRAAKSSPQPVEDGEKPIRADELRRAFNTPFWPHVLATTSVGQEGLDFHAWCETLLHWDLCNNPVDMEQREGRIRRYGGLAIRRRLAQLLWNKETRLVPFTSPWVKIEKLAERKFADTTGLSPWWVCEGADIKRLTIELPASEQQQRLEVLRQQRFLYRLALGQPNQEDLLEVLRDKYGENQSLKDIGLNLCPFIRRVRKIQISSNEKSEI